MHGHMSSPGPPMPKGGDEIADVALEGKAALDATGHHQCQRQPQRSIELQHAAAGSESRVHVRLELHQVSDEQ